MKLGKKNNSNKRGSVFALYVMATLTKHDALWS